MAVEVTLFDTPIWGLRLCYGLVPHCMYLRSNDVEALVLVTALFHVVPRTSLDSFALAETDQKRECALLKLLSTLAVALTTLKTVNGDANPWQNFGKNTFHAVLRSFVFQMVPV